MTRRRRVFVTLELETDTPLPKLRQAAWWASLFGQTTWTQATRVLQAGANVARATAPQARQRNRRRRTAR